MKREIKFRAWDKNKKVFIPTDLWAIVSTDFNAFGIMLKDWEDYKEGEYFYETSQELSQFTGLTDKNGKEIYEHDILISKYGDKKPFEILFGEYQTYEEQVGSESTSIGFYWNETDGEQVGFGKSIEGNMDAYEVIGNIYENPELL